MRGAPSEQDAADRNRLVGYLEVLAAASLWGSSGIFSVNLFRLGVTPGSLALLRPLVGAAVLLAMVAAVRPGVLKIRGRGLLFLVGVGGGLTALFQVAYQMAMDSVGVPATVGLLYLAPAFVVAAAAPLLGERPSPLRVTLAAVSVVGVWLTATGARGADVALTPVGVAWGVTAAASYAGYTLFGRRAAPIHGSLATVAWSTAGACVILAAVLPAAGVSVTLPATLRGWVLLLAYGVLTIPVASFLFYDALGRMEAGRVSIASTLEPVVAALLATWLVSQHLTPTGWLGLVLVVSGVAGAYAVKPDPVPVHE